MLGSKQTVQMVLKHKRNGMVEVMVLHFCIIKYFWNHLLLCMYWNYKWIFIDLTIKGFYAMFACLRVQWWYDGKMKISQTKPLDTYMHTAHFDFIVSLHDEIANEPYPNCTKRCHRTAVFTKPLAVSHLLAHLQWRIAGSSAKTKIATFCMFTCNNVP